MQLTLKLEPPYRRLGHRPSAFLFKVDKCGLALIVEITDITQFQTQTPAEPQSFGIDQDSSSCIEVIRL